MTTPRRVARTPLILMLAGVVWIGVTFSTCSVFHGDPVPGSVDFDPARNTMINLYSLVTIRGVTPRTATWVIWGLMSVGAMLLLSGIVIAIRRRDRGSGPEASD